MTKTGLVRWLIGRLTLPRIDPTLSKNIHMHTHFECTLQLQPQPLFQTCSALHIYFRNWQCIDSCSICVLVSIAIAPLLPLHVITNTHASAMSRRRWTKKMWYEIRQIGNCCSEWIPFGLVLLHLDLNFMFRGPLATHRCITASCVSKGLHQHDIVICVL